MLDIFECPLPAVCGEWRGSGGGGFLFHDTYVTYLEMYEAGRKILIILFFPSFQNLYFSEGTIIRYLLLERVLKKNAVLKNGGFFLKKKIS